MEENIKQGDQSNDRQNDSSQTDGDGPEASQSGESESRGRDDKQDDQFEHLDNTRSPHAPSALQDGREQSGHSDTGRQVILKDPKTGEPLRDQTPGQQSEWVGRGEGADLDEEGRTGPFGESPDERLKKDLEE